MRSIYFCLGWFAAIAYWVTGLALFAPESRVSPWLVGVNWLCMSAFAFLCRHS